MHVTNSSYFTAIREHQAENLDLAEKLYHDLLKDDPQNHEVLHLLGILLAQRQDFLNARYYIENALLYDPKSPTLHNSMGNVLKNLGLYEEAASHYATALQLQDGNATAHNNLGIVLYKLNRDMEAKEHYCEAIRLRPRYVDAYYNLSLILIKQKEWQEARKNLELVLQLNPEHVQARSSLACLLQILGDHELAMEHYLEVLKSSDDSNIVAHHNLGVILTNKGDHDGAIRHFKKVLDLQPEHIDALHNMGTIFLSQGKVAEALPYFLSLADLTKDFDVYYNLGVIYLDGGMADQAAVYFAKALGIRSNDFATNVNLGGIYLQRREFVQAEQCYVRALSMQPDNQEIAYILAAIQQHSQHLRAPTEYVKHLFDQYAPYFEKHLEHLGYEVPQLLFDAVAENLTEYVDSSVAILDLGCGTGMGGIRFRSLANSLIGVDVSEKMLEQARKKNIYTDLKLGNIEEVIQEFSGIDLVIAADTLVYFGCLDTVFEQVRRVLKAGGLFAFSVEELADDFYPYTLQRSARFAHTNKYLYELTAKHNFILLNTRRATLRSQDGQLVYGNIFVLKK